MKITAQEQRVLASLHLQSYVKWGAIKKAKRLQLLHDLTDKGLLDQNGRLTDLGIKAGNLDKSKGHICFSDDLKSEYFIKNGMVYRDDTYGMVLTDGYRPGRYFCALGYYRTYQSRMEEKMAAGHA